MPPTMSPRRAWLVWAAMNPSVVQPSNMGSSAGPIPRIWKKWSITQRESNPASSALRTIRASVGPMAGVPPGQLKRLIWRPIFMPSVSQVGLAWMPAHSGDVAGYPRRRGWFEPRGANRLAEEVDLGWHEDVRDDAAVAGRRGRTAHERDRPASRLAQHQLRGRGDLVRHRP